LDNNQYLSVPIGVRRRDEIEETQRLAAARRRHEKVLPPEPSVLDGARDQPAQARTAVRVGRRARIEPVPQRYLEGREALLFGERRKFIDEPRIAKDVPRDIELLPDGDRHLLAKFDRSHRVPEIVDAHAAQFPYRNIERLCPTHEIPPIAG
jgi:hypothetical protein